MGSVSNGAAGDGATEPSPVHLRRESVQDRVRTHFFLFKSRGQTGLAGEDSQAAALIMREVCVRVSRDWAFGRLIPVGAGAHRFDLSGNESDMVPPRMADRGEGGGIRGVGADGRTDRIHECRYAMHSLVAGPAFSLLRSAVHWGASTLSET